MSKADYYELLGVERSADAETLKTAFRKKAMQYHPDRNPGDKEAEAKFKALNEAYQVLSDADKRAAYDRYGHQAFEQGGFGGAGGFGDFNFSGGFADIFEEMFGDFMGGRGGQTRSNRGADLRYNLAIRLEDAFLGQETQIRVPGTVACGDCTGSGAADGSAPATCTYCNGTGKQRAQQGFFLIEKTCAGCGGQGQVIKKPCKTCAGSGRVKREKTLAVSIPPGVEDGTRIRLSGEGETGLRGGGAGDLYIFLNIEPHPLFQREGANLLCHVPIPIATAALGGEVTVPGIDGKPQNVTVPAGTQHGQQFRLKGQGMSVLRQKQRGDLFIQAKIEVPVNLSKAQQKLLREFAETLGDKATPQATSFADQVKEFMG
jgi:molecular chaperone DnaJ